MALITELGPEAAREVCEAHCLGELIAVEALSAGSVNSNFFLHTDKGKFFARIYEEADSGMVRFERALIDHLWARGVGVPKRITGVREVTVGSKPVGVFEAVGGRERCHRELSAKHLWEMGDTLARVHTAGENFLSVQQSRFGRDGLLARLERIDVTVHPELGGVLDRVQRVLSERLPSLREGVVHGDLFRDNVRWHEDKVLCLLDWDSASTGSTLYDLAVVWLAWTFTTDFDLSLGRALFDGYQRHRPLTPDERQGLWSVSRFACARFALTRVTDFYLRGGPSTPGFRDYARFVSRLDKIEALSPEALIARLA